MTGFAEGIRFYATFGNAKPSKFLFLSRSKNDTFTLLSPFPFIHIFAKTFRNPLLLFIYIWHYLTSSTITTLKKEERKLGSAVVGKNSQWLL